MFRLHLYLLYDTIGVVNWIMKDVDQVLTRFLWEKHFPNEYCQNFDHLRVSILRAVNLLLDICMWWSMLRTRKVGDKNLWRHRVLLRDLSYYRVYNRQSTPALHGFYTSTILKNQRVVWAVLQYFVTVSTDRCGRKIDVVWASRLDPKPNLCRLPGYTVSKIPLILFNANHLVDIRPIIIKNFKGSYYWSDILCSFNKSK